MITTVAFALLTAAWLSQIVWIVARPGAANLVSFVLVPTGALLLVASLVVRSLQMSFVAVTSTYEALVFLSAALGFVLSYMQLREIRGRPGGGSRELPDRPGSAADRNRIHPTRVEGFVVFGGTLLIIAFLALASSPLVPGDVTPPVPVLRSHWLVLHVTLAFIGEGFFAVSFVASLVQLVTRDPDYHARLDRITYTTIAVGYPVFTAGALVFGAVWANYAWGRYWGWDPKETWALVTWLTYTVYLHVRLVARRRGKLTAVVSVAGFLFASFTFFGVNYLLAGLHSYG